MDYQTFRNAISAGGSCLDRFHLHVGLLDRSLFGSKRASSLKTAVLCHNLVEKRRLTTQLDQELIYVSYSPASHQNGPVLFFSATDVYRKYVQGVLPLMIRQLIKLLHHSTIEIRGMHNNRFYLSMGFLFDDSNSQRYLNYGPSPNETVPFDQSPMASRLHRMEQHHAMYVAEYCQESFLNLIKVFRHNLYMNALLNTFHHATWELTSLSPHSPFGASLRSTCPEYSLWGLMDSDIMEYLQCQQSKDLLVGIPESGALVYVFPIMPESPRMLRNILEPPHHTRYRLYRYRWESGAFIELAR